MFSVTEPYGVHLTVSQIDRLAKSLPIEPRERSGEQSGAGTLEHSKYSMNTFAGLRRFEPGTLVAKR
jgi:hypothetical protein